MPLIGLNGSTPKTAGMIHMYWVRKQLRYAPPLFDQMLLCRTMMGQAMASMTEIEVLLSEETYGILTLVISGTPRIQK